MQKRNRTILALFLLLVFTACQQEVDDIIQQAAQCRITTGYYYGGSGGMNDSAQFDYDGAGNLQRISNRDGHYDYQYNGDRVTVRRLYDSLSNDYVIIDSVFYLPGGQIAEMRSYDLTGWFGMDTAMSKYRFLYANNQLSRTEYIEFYNISGMALTDTFAATVVWNAAGNIEKVLQLDQFGDPYDSIQYQYNAHPNYFNVVHPNFFLFDPQFQLHVGLEANLPYFWSRNNVINTNIYGSFDNPVDYGLDSLQRVTAVDMGGFEYYKYRYRCP